MILCRAENLSRNYTDQILFQEINFQVERGDRIGLVGPNGAGKTTLMRLLIGHDQPDSGNLHFHAGLRVALLTQFPDYPPERTLLEEVHVAMKPLEDLYQQMLQAGEAMARAQEEAERVRWGRIYDSCQEELRLHGGYDFTHRIEEVLFGLRFTEADFQRQLGTFSGGQQSRVLLAKLLLSAPDLMLLDEPTNHLDIQTTEWLEEYLTRQATSMIIVSHDRYFLDKTVTKIMELYGGKLTLYPGNYQQYQRLREERQKVNERILAKSQEAIAHQEDYVRRNRYGQLAKQAKSREKLIEKLKEQQEEIEVVADIRGPRMMFGEVERAGDIILTAKELGKSFGSLKLFQNAQFQIQRGERVALVGPNGAGKTTLLRIILGEEPPSQGEIRLGHGVRIGYLDQELQSLDLSLTPLEVVRPPSRYAEKLEIFRALLARFGIKASMLEQSLSTLSGGERTRVALARLSAENVNLLILDEPTNHLDLWACEALEEGLKSYEGTLLVVSHDRYFLNAIAEKLLYVADGTIRIIPGNYDELTRRKQQEGERNAAKANPKTITKTKEAETEDKPKRKRKYPFRKVTDIEADISKHEARVAELETSLTDPKVYADGIKIQQVTQELETLRGKLEQLLEHWEEAMELNPS